MAKAPAAAAGKDKKGGGPAGPKTVALQMKPGDAKPSAVGPSLGVYGINLPDFCKKFNAATQGMDPEMVLPIRVTIAPDKSFTILLKTPLASALIRKELNVPKGSATPNKAKIGKLTKVQLRKIAQVKFPDTTAADIEAAMRSIAGTARSMGVDVES